MPRLMLLADAGSPHTCKWARELARRGWDVHVLSLTPGEIPDVQTHRLHPLFPGKLGYLTVVNQVKAFVRGLLPDLLHAHYATSYGLLGALSGFHPFVISVWGTDVYDFPRTSPLHQALLVRNLAVADALTSTSHAMATVTAPYAPERAIEVIPFGVDLDRFAPGAPPELPTIGCAKILEPKYGQEFLICALALLVEREPNRPLRLLLAGEGYRREALERLVRDLGLSDRVVFLGRLPADDVPAFMRGLTIFAMPSVDDSESFGVAALEAAACGLPVVSTTVGGVSEVVRDGATGLLVPPRDAGALADALGRLLSDPAERAAFGAKGREMARESYDLHRNADKMEALYHRLLAARKA
jgi:glycosyltransferase involved in cell wall biosynthesis